MKILCSLLLLFAETASAAERPNVLFIAVDDLRPQIGAFGDPLAKTPNIDAIANRGTAFLRAYCQQAVCSPSRTSLLTGCRPDTTKVYDLVTHFRTHMPNAVTLPEYFKNNGYETRAIGKIYHGGYDDEKSWSKPHIAGGGRGYGPAGLKILADEKKRWETEGRKPKGKSDQPRGPAWEAADVNDEDLPDGQVANGAIKILQEVKDKPFFLAVGFFKPHLPFVAPKKYFAMHDPARLPMPSHTQPPKDSPTLAWNPGGELRTYANVPKGPIPAAMTRDLIHAYYASATYMDAQLGRVLAELERLKLRENTIIVLWGDHGWQLGEHGFWCKHTNYELATRAPLVVSAPKQKAPASQTMALVEFVDIYPSLAEMAGLPKPEKIEGISFAPLLDDPKRPWKDAAFSQYPKPGGSGVGRVMGYAMKTDTHRFVAWESADGKFAEYELYDHRVDLDENFNVAKKPENAALVNQLKQRLKAGWKTTQIPPVR